MGSRRDCTWILGLPGFRVVTIEGEDGRGDQSTASRIWSAAGGAIPAVGVADGPAACDRSKERTWDDLPWAAHPVTLVYQQRRVICRRCGIRTERIEFADAKARVTRRLRQQIGVDCQSMPTSHAAVRHGVSWGKARRAEQAFLAGVGSHARETAAAPYRARRDPARQGPAILDRAVGRRARRGDRIAPGPHGGARPPRC